MGESTLKAESSFGQRKRTSNLSEVTFCYATSYIVALLATILNIYFSTDKFAFEIPRFKCEVDLCWIVALGSSKLMTWFTEFVGRLNLYTLVYYYHDGVISN